MQKIYAYFNVDNTPGDHLMFWIGVILLMLGFFIITGLVYTGFDYWLRTKVRLSGQITAKRISEGDRGIKRYYISVLDTVDMTYYEVVCPDFNSFSQLKEGEWVTFDNYYYRYSKELVGSWLVKVAVTE